MPPKSRTKQASKRKHPQNDPGGSKKRPKSAARSVSQSDRSTIFDSSQSTRDSPPIPSDSKFIVDPTTAGSTSGSRVLNTTPRVRKAGRTVWNGLKRSLSVLEQGSNVCPPLKSALTEVIARLDAIHISEVNRDDYEELANELAGMSENLGQYVGQLGSESNNGTVARIARSIEFEASCIEKQRSHGAVRQAIEANQDQENVRKHYQRIQALFRQLLADMMLRSWETADEQFKMLLLGGMSPVSDARYNSGYSTTIKRRGCTPETREKVIMDLQSWVRDPDGAKVYWMNGMAGTGKTTIAFSLCEWLEGSRLLGASFFCSRISSSCSNLNQIVPTIAYQLARYSPAFRSALCKALRDDPDAGGLNVVLQFEKLVKKPLMDVKDAVPDAVVVVIDALDECQDRYGVRLMLRVLLRHAASLPLKFFVSSRPEPSIQLHMQSLDGYAPSILHLHDIEHSIVEQDIKKYLKEALGGMHPPPSNAQVARLAEPAGKLFIYAATVVRHILPDHGIGNPAARLNALLAANASSKDTKKTVALGRYKQLDELYEAILAEALDVELQPQESETTKLVLNTVLCAKEPMAVESLATLLERTECDVLSALRPLRSVLHVSDAGGVVSALHASFPDYIFDLSRSKGFYCDKKAHSGLLARRCFGVMRRQLKFNICNLEDSLTLDRDIANLEETVEHNISSVLFYSCRYWADHLALADGSETHRRVLEDFLFRRLLFWIEVLNLKKCIGDGERILMQAQSWLSTQKTPTLTSTSLADARNFVTMFAGNACSLSTCHLYISALEFLPRRSSVLKYYRNRLPGGLKVEGTIVKTREQAALATWGVGAPVHSIASSPDGSCIASGSYDMVVRVWDARTGHLVAAPFEGHTDLVTSVAFSPDGSRVASGSCDETIRLWDARSGDLVAGPFEGNTDGVCSVAFSSDGACIVSGSNESAIRVWDVSSGKTIAGPFKGHTDAIIEVAFSPDGAYIASCSYDGTIRLCHARTGELAASPLHGHDGPVWDVAFSPKGTRILSGSSDKTIRVWDTRSGELIVGPILGHTDMIYAVAYSVDGNLIVSGSRDKTVRVWSACNGELVAGPFLGHKDHVWSVKFSPDSTRVISGSRDKTIRIWDTHCGNHVVNPSSGHTDAVSSVAFSYDGTHIVSGSRDRTIRVWEAGSGELVSGPFYGHKGHIWSVNFSPNGKRIVSGSEDKTIRVWDSKSGKLLVGPLEGHTDSVHSAACSPDGTLVVSGSRDRTIRVWNAHSGAPVAGPFLGHLDWANPVVFSLDDNRLIFTGSHGKVTQAWDTVTGDLKSLSGWPQESYAPLLNKSSSTPDGSRTVAISYNKRLYADIIQISDTHSPNDLVESQVGPWAFSPDGWIKCDGKHLFWIPPDMLDFFPRPPVMVSINPYGSVSVGYSNLLLGQRWIECYVDG